MIDPNKQRYIFHAGMYKTATSTIQTLLATHRDYVAERYSILYPQTGGRRNTGSANKNSVAHHKLYHAARDNKAGGHNAQAVTNLKGKLRSEVEASGLNTIVLSSELFTSSSLDAKKRLIDMMGKGQKEILFTIRRPDDYVESIANQSYKNFRKPSIVFERPLPVLQNIQEWRSLVGAENVHLLAFTKNDYNPYLQRIFQLIGVEGDDPMIDFGLHDNPAVTLNGFLLRRTLVQLFQERDIEIDRLQRHRLNIALDAMEATQPKSPKAQFMTVENKQTVMATNAEQMEQVANLMSQPEAQRLRTDLERTISSTPPNADDAPEMTPDMLAEIYKLFTSGIVAKCLAL